MNVVRDSELSPIYEKLYHQVAGLPAMEDLKERVFKDLREATVLNYRYEKASYGNRVDVFAKVLVGNRTVRIQFQATGDENRQHFSIDTEHLLTEEQVTDVYFDNVARQGKRICPHGLVQESTVRHGASPRGRNQFAPWMLSRIFHSDEFGKLRDRVKSRVQQEILANLIDTPAFVDFSENLQTEDIVNKLSEWSHLPPDVLHRAIDLMYVKATMER